jgi:hypothetical protein
MTWARITKAPRLAAMALLALLAPAPAIAGPPEGVSGRMVFDKVADRLQAYRKVKDDQKRAEWIRSLARIKEPWVYVVLGEALDDTAYVVRSAAAYGLWDREVGFHPWPETQILWDAEKLWKENAHSWRYRAKEVRH